MVIRYAEFCTGIGGFRLGIEKSKLKTKNVYSNEIDRDCEVTYKNNFGKFFDSKDLFSIEPTSLPDFDMICAGFPCQPFSQAGKGMGFSDPRGTVFHKLTEFVTAKRPKIIFFENVPNLKSHDQGRTFQFISKKIDELGYNLFYKILDSSYFGVPQSRPRIYLIGFNRDVLPEAKLEFTERITPRTALRSFLNNGDYSIPISDKWQEYIDLYTNKKTLDEMSFDVPKTRKELERVAGACDVNDCVFQIRSSGIRAYSLDEPFPTFAVSNSGGGAMIPVLSKERRHLNLTEMRRIMGFPESYNMGFTSRTNAIKQLANAVCPPVITSICNDIYKAIK